ncbi:hypothetical protein OCAE111667_09210 [Occultella aeris]|uniref:Pilus assembly protein n=1 Tax=Occultella aeris TaxID=2761496 RepID=A0A7M4DJT9_9MICO|nr:hypothetical protein [Occultella aeris]VZO37324.1 hypothetical protein HALOF300_02397 [Occultella aeris]
MYRRITKSLRRRLDQVRTRAERGASTVEWVIITACLVAIAVGLVVLITSVVNNRSAGIF